MTTLAGFICHVLLLNSQGIQLIPYLRPLLVVQRHQRGQLVRGDQGVQGIQYLPTQD